MFQGFFFFPLLTRCPQCIRVDGWMPTGLQVVLWVQPWCGVSSSAAGQQLRAGAAGDKKTLQGQKNINLDDGADAAAGSVSP